MEIMVGIGSKDDRKSCKYYKIEDIAGFEAEVSKRLVGVEMPSLSHENRLYRQSSHSIKVNNFLDYRSIENISKIYGDEISESKYNKEFSSGKWWTKPSLTTAISRTVDDKMKGGSFENTYSIMLKIDPSQIKFLT